MKEVKKNKTSIGSVLSSLVLLFFFIGLVLIAFVKKDNIYYFTKSLFVNNVFFAKVTNFKGNILINDKLVNSLKNTFYKNVLVQTGNNSFVELYFSTKESIKIYPNSHILIKNLKKFNISVILKKGNFKLTQKNIISKSEVIYKNTHTLLSKWAGKPKFKDSTNIIANSDILKKTHIADILTNQGSKNSIFYLIKKYKKYFLYCQANALRKNIKPTGKMLVNLHIINNKITETYVISSNLNTYLQNCALAVFKKITFKFTTKQNFWTHYPLYFR